MRKVAWFSCGASSAVAAKLSPDAEVVYCDTMATEEDDNERFFSDVQKWIERPIRVIRSSRFATVDDVFEKTRYMSGPQGARCTVEMKKVPRFAYQEADDVHIFGFTVEETKRIKKFEENNPELKLEWILRDQHVTKSDCFIMLQKAGIELPVLYKKGYRNNNCLGCVKATSPRYWNMIRRDYPEVFERRCQQSRELNVKLVQYRGNRIFLDDLRRDHFQGKLENITCGPECASGKGRPPL